MTGLSLCKERPAVFFSWFWELQQCYADYHFIYTDGSADMKQGVVDLASFRDVGHFMPVFPNSIRCLLCRVMAIVNYLLSLFSANMCSLSSLHLIDNLYTIACIVQVFHHLFFLRELPGRRCHCFIGHVAFVATSWEI